MKYIEYKEKYERLQSLKRELDRKIKEFKPIHSSYITYLLSNPHSMTKKALERDINKLRKKIIEMVE